VTIAYAGIVAPGVYQINATIPPLQDGDQPIIATIAGATTQQGVSIAVKNASPWPDPNTTSEGVARLQTAFYNIALSGDDQLRQRASFALAQIAVSSAIKDTAFEQMVSYQRALGDYAFGPYRDFLTTITLNPAMGDFLDMVNNDKANASAGTSPNENYARESMQLFTLGLMQLDPPRRPSPRERH
jgi:uncharacterized protein (DUF1800 family)